MCIRDRQYEGNWKRENPSSYQHEVDNLVSPAFTETPDGPAVIETYTVCFAKGEPERGIVIGRLSETGQRFVANTPSDAKLLIAMTQSEQIGRKGNVSNDEEMNLFVPS